MTAQVEGRAYRVEFSYRRREGKRATLARNSPIEGVTCCAIVADDEPRLISVAAAVCSAGDNWSRREGRLLAFQRAVNECGILRPLWPAFAAWFVERFPQPVRHIPIKWSLSNEEIARRIEAG